MCHAISFLVANRLRKLQSELLCVIVHCCQGVWGSGSSAINRELLSKSGVVLLGKSKLFRVGVICQILTDN